MATVEQQASGQTAADSIVVENPATGVPIATLRAAGDSDVAAMVERARAAQTGWQARGFAGRAKDFAPGAEVGARQLRPVPRHDCGGDR